MLWGEDLMCMKRLGRLQGEDFGDVRGLGCNNDGHNRR